MSHLNYTRRVPSSPWRKVSIGSWKPTGDSSIHAFEEFNVEPALAWCAEKKISFNTFLLKIIGQTISEKDTINRVIRFGKVYQRATIRIFYHVLPSKQTDDLSGALIDQPHLRSADELEVDLRQQINAIRRGNDPMKASKKTFARLPGIAARPMLNVLSFLLYSLNIKPFFVPAPNDPFGSVMVTHIGSFGLTKACTPIAPYTRIPMVIAVGKTEKRVISENDEVVQREMATLGFTFDHRIMDGIQFSEFIQVLTHYFSHPYELK